MGTYNFEKKSAEEQSRIPHNDGFVKSDGWINVLTGLGMRGRDKNVNAHFHNNIKRLMMLLVKYYVIPGGVRV